MLVAVVVLGTAGLAVLGSMFTSIAVSDVHRKEATAGAVARDYSERIAGAPDLGCASAAGTYGSLAARVDIPTGYTASRRSDRVLDRLRLGTACTTEVCSGSPSSRRAVTARASSAVVVVRQP